MIMIEGKGAKKDGGVRFRAVVSANAALLDAPSWLQHSEWSGFGKLVGRRLSF